jgi:protein TonB
MHMPRDLFGAVTDPPAQIGTRSRLTLPLSLAAHAVALAALIVVPLVATNALPLPDELRLIVLTTPDLPPEPPPIPRQPHTTSEPPPNPDAAPLEAPPAIAPEPPARPPSDVGEIAPGSVIPGAVLGDGGGDRGVAHTPPPPPATRAPVPVGGVIVAPAKIHDVAPEYPRMARDARIQGVVIIQATIGVDGRVVDAEILRPIPFLSEAALAAVRQWRFTTPQLNGEPIPVIMTVTVNFRLN